MIKRNKEAQSVTVNNKIETGKLVYCEVTKETGAELGSFVKQIIKCEKEKNMQITSMV